MTNTIRKNLHLLTISLFSLFLIITSCSRDDDKNEEDFACLNNGGTASQIKFVRSNSDNGYDNTILTITQCFSYDSQNRLESFKSRGYNHLYSYDVNGNIISLGSERDDGGIDIIRSFEYDQQQRLINYSTFDTDVSLAYENNIVTVTGSAITELELDAEGFVTKLSKENGTYLNFEYDTQHNLTKINVFASNGGNELQYGKEYIYDSNPNPFYGHLKSIYLERFMNPFQRDIIGYFFSTIDFPYLQNNIITIDEWSTSHGNDRLQTSTYTYNNMEQPIEEQSSHSVGGESERFFDY